MTVPMSFVRAFIVSPFVPIALCDLVERRIGGGGKGGPKAG